MKKVLSLFKFSEDVLSPPLISAHSTLAERLGYSKEAKLLIIHADDAGLAHSENAATIKAFEEGSINSASIMVPSPWFQEMATYAKNNTKLDIGIHLTLTAEWKNYKWGGVLPATEIKSLLNTEGYFYAKVKDVVEHANLNEVEKELTAQIERALMFEVQPTHLDSHMATLFSTPELFKIYIKLGEKYRLPVFIPMNVVKDYPELLKKITTSQIPIDNYTMMLQNISKEDWTAFYINALEKLEPGVHQFLVHVAYNNDEMQAVAIDHPSFGVTWRQNDFDTLKSIAFKEALHKNKIQLITWRDIKNIQY